MGDWLVELGKLAVGIVLCGIVIIGIVYGIDRLAPASRPSEPSPEVCTLIDPDDDISTSGTCSELMARFPDHLVSEGRSAEGVTSCAVGDVLIFRSTGQGLICLTPP